LIGAILFLVYLSIFLPWMTSIWHLVILGVAHFLTAEAFCLMQDYVKNKSPPKG
jgi:hypothetical protein